MTLLAARGISAGYGTRDVLAGCDLELAAGELIAVVGPNGAGKSTLVRVLSGLLRPRAGRVTLRERPLGSLSRAEIAREIAVVPQVFETLFPFTVREIVALGRVARLDALGRATAADQEAVARAMEALALAPLAGRGVVELSGGERQRVVLAMALAQEPIVLLLDEPTVHLDPAHQLATLRLLRGLARERGLAVLAVMHDLNLAALADRVVVLADGRVVRDASPADAIEERLVREIFGAGWQVELHGGRPVVYPQARA